MTLPYTRVVCQFEYPSIQTSVGNDNYPGPCEVYGSFVDSTGRIWVGTYLPIYVFDPWDDIPVLSPFGENRNVEGVGDRGEFYSWTERVPGEVWGGAYSAQNEVTRFFPIPMGVNLAPSGIVRGWRPRGAASDGTFVYFSIGPTSPNGLTPYGGIVRLDAAGTPTVYLDVVNQDFWGLDYFDGKLYALASGEGIPGATPGARFYQIDVGTMTVDWSVLLGGDRGLSMYRLSDTQYLVISHLTSTTEARMQLIDLVSQTRVWIEIFNGVNRPVVRIYGRARKAIVFFDGRLWTVSDDYIHEIDLDARTLPLRCNVSKTSTNTGAKRITNLVASDRLGLGMGLGNRFWAWDPRAP